MRLGSTIALAILTLPRTTAAQAPLDTVSRLGDVDREYRRLGAAIGNSIWPGFRPDTIPVIYVFPNRGSALLGWRGSLPNGYQRVPGTAAAWKNAQDLGAASTGVDLGGRSAAQVVASSLEPSFLLSTAFHEAFHVFERASVQPGRRFGTAENSFYVASYPVFDVRNEKLFAMEGRLLQQALAAESPARKRQLAREFVAIRRDRHRSLDADFSEFDRASETNEGLAEYALVRALMAIQSDQSLPGDWRRSARSGISDHQTHLGSLTANVTQSLRLRFYWTGPAQALLLDQLADRSWKQEMMDRNETLTEALARATGIDDAERRALRAALESGDTTLATAQAERSVSRLREIRTRQVDSILAQPGILLELSASELRSRDFGFCGFDPQNHLQVSPTMQLQTRWWKPCAGASLTSEFNVPSVHDNTKGTVRAVIGDESEVKITAAGQPLSLADGQRIESVTDLRVVAPRATVQSARARVAKNGRTITITPLP